MKEYRMAVGWSLKPSAIGSLFMKKKRFELGFQQVNVLLDPLPYIEFALLYLEAICRKFLLRWFLRRKDVCLQIKQRLWFDRF
jgi:hypothetical protein